MHSVKRVRQSSEALEAKKQREKSKIKEYLTLTEDVFVRKKRQDWSKDAFELTQRLLQLNPEFYTIWNYRRNILLNGIFPQRRAISDALISPLSHTGAKCNSTPEEINGLLSNELTLTTTALKANPKVYWIWNHRRWCLGNVPDGPDSDSGPTFGWKKTKWDRELFVVEKMLDADARNFHAWNYRRHVLAGMPVSRSELSELAYTTRKIEASFSNFSAWHQRSKIYTSLWDAGDLDATKSREEEFELVRNALYTDPDDQSAWIYHRWLIGSGQNLELLRREIAVIEELLEEQPDSKWCMESLVHYKRLLLRNHSPSQPQCLRDNCLQLLYQLEQLDPARKHRYQQLEIDCHFISFHVLQSSFSGFL
ncbi:rab-protein geranylgeranyltransferase [Leucogyrophana mollusca]|uniref:Rab-protein geranylgeranyltransferase n=1 Tax=Leucogyrophana mollusca TaxID=85980 RepID=A0ACB8BLA1_9AGAM|nr:rab-protein geranylgeranyltransferase [Leucogyrophana mollusca]